MRNSGLKLESPFFLVEEKGRHFIYDGGNGGVFEINRLLKEIIKLSKIYHFDRAEDIEKLTQDLKGAYPLEDIKVSLNKLKTINQKGLLFNKGGIYQLYEKKYQQNIEQKKLHSLCLTISHQCNLGCKYCFAGGGNYGYEKMIMSKEVANKCIDYWFNNLNKHKKNFTVAFFGGEPLLNKEVMIYSINYINDLMKDIHGEINYIITTNGTIIDEEIIEVFKNNNFDVSISIDGIRQIHNENRPYVSGKESFDDIINNVRKFKGKFKRISAQITVTKKDIPFLSEAVKEIWGIGINEVSSNIVFDKTERYSYEDYKIYHEEVKLLSNITYENLIVGKKQVYGSLITGMKKIHAKDFSTTCFFWNHTVSIFSAKGNAYRCYRYVGNKEHELGNVYDEDFTVFKNILKKPVVEKCTECWAQLFCGDGCPYENYLYEEDINVPVEEWCVKTKILIEESLKLYIKILVNKPELFEKIFNKTDLVVGQSSSTNQEQLES